MGVGARQPDQGITEWTSSTTLLDPVSLKPILTITVGLCTLSLSTLRAQNVNLLAHFDFNDNSNPEAVDVVVDINPAKHGKFVAGAGQRIASPSDLVPLRPDLVVVMNPIYRKEIAADLEGMGLRPVLLAVGEDDPGREP